MAKYRNWRCPECSGIFKHLHVLSDDPPPDRCPLCDAWVAERPPEPAFVPMAPRIAESPFAKSWDQTARAIEESSIQRAAEAAEVMGVSPWETNHLKVTDLREPGEMREGDTAAIMPANIAAAAQRLTVGPSKPSFQQYEGGTPDYQPGVGPAKAGLAMRDTIASTHQARAQQMTRAGNMGSWSEK